MAAILGPQFAASSGAGALSDLTSHGPPVARSVQNHQTPGAQNGLDPVESGESDDQAKCVVVNVLRRVPDSRWRCRCGASCM